MKKMTDLRDRIKSLRPDEAKVALQQLTWLLPNPTSVRFINQAIDDTAEMMKNRPEPEPTKGTRWCESDMTGIAVLSGATWHPAAEEPYICLLAGRGEVQMNEDGDTWYFRWDVLSDEGNIIVDQLEIGRPVGGIVTVAKWFADQARKYEDR